MLDNSNLRGLGVALVTPFDANRQVDYNALGALVKHTIDGGVDYLVALGTTAETPTLSCEEKASIAECVKSHNTKKLPIVVGIGGNNTDEIIRSISKFDLNGVAAVLSVTPYYNKPSQRGMYEHYKAIAENSPVPIMLYNVPARTGVNMSAETTLKLAHTVDNICGVKEACGSVNQMAHILRDRPTGFIVTSGDDCMALPLISIGGDGVISVGANAFPKLFSQMINAGFKGDIATAAALQMRLLEATEALFEEGNPTGIKTALTAIGLIENNLRLPLVAGSEALMGKFKMLIAKYNL